MLGLIVSADWYLLKSTNTRRNGRKNTGRNGRRLNRKLIEHENPLIKNLLNARATRNIGTHLDVKTGIIKEEI